MAFEPDRARPSVEFPARPASLVAGDDRRYTANVAGPASLLVAKLHKLGERKTKDSERLNDKDAHDVYRLFFAVPTDSLRATLVGLTHDALAGPVTIQAMVYLRELFAAGPDAAGSVMAGRAEEGVGEPDTVAASVAAVANDLARALDL